MFHVEHYTEKTQVNQAERRMFRQANVKANCVRAAAKYSTGRARRKAVVFN